MLAMRTGEQKITHKGRRVSSGGFVGGKGYVSWVNSHPVVVCLWVTLVRLILLIEVSLAWLNHLLVWAGSIL